MNIADLGLWEILLRVVAAIVIIVVTAILAGIVNRVLTNQLTKIKALSAQQGGDSLAGTLGTIGSLIVWLFGLMAVLALFQLTAVLSPLQALLTDFLGVVPNIVAAGLIFFVGLILAKIARQLVETGLRAIDLERRARQLFGSASGAVDRSTGSERSQSGQQPGAAPLQGEEPSGATQVQAMEQAGADEDEGGGSGTLASVLGAIVYVVIVVVVTVAALQVLGIQALSQPATQMLSIAMAALPQIIGAAALLIIGIIAAKFLGDFVESLLNDIGTNRRLADMGVDSERVDGAKIGAVIVRIVIILFFAVAAANLIGLPAVTNVLNQVLDLGVSVLIGAAVIAVGVAIAGLLARLASGMAAQIIRVATIVLFAAMGLNFMGLADSIVNLAFAALVIGGAAAAALAFGLGGRDAAARQLEKMERKVEDEQRSGQPVGAQTTGAAGGAQSGGSGQQPRGSGPQSGGPGTPGGPGPQPGGPGPQSSGQGPQPRGPGSQQGNVPPQRGDGPPPLRPHPPRPRPDAGS